MGPRKNLTGKLLAACLILGLGAAAVAGEKVRFGPVGDVDLPTRPERSFQDSISSGPRNSVRSGSPVPAAVPAPASVETVTRSTPADADERNWIFRDTRSSKGVQKALGVETYDGGENSIADRDSMTVIQDYFARQRSQTDGLAVGNASNPGLSSAKPGRDRRIQGPQYTGSSAALSVDRSEGIFSGGGFQGTINSDDPTVRRYFRNLYTTPGSQDSLISLGSPGTAVSKLARPTNPIASEQKNFSDLANKAALVNSLSSQNDSPDNSAAGARSQLAVRPKPADPDLPVVNEGKLFEKRNGLIVFPARKF